MSCKITLRKDDDYYHDAVEMTFNGDETAVEWVKRFRYFMLACSFTANTVENYISEDIINE